MSRKRKAAPAPPPRSHSRAVNLVAVALLAFLAGSVCTWILMRQGPANTQPPTASSSSAGISGELPPDTSNMSPAQAALTLGNWHYDRKHWPQAIASYEQALSLGLDNSDVRTDLGNCYRFSGQPQRALEQYALAQKQNPQHEHSLFNTATLYAQVLNDPVRAADFAREYVRRFPQGKSIAAAQQLLGGSEGHADERADVAKWLKEQTAPARQ